MKSNNGFTLVELMVVIVIIGVLAAVAMPKFAQAINYARVDTALVRQGYEPDMRFEDVGGANVVNGLITQFEHIQDSTKYDSVAVALIKIIGGVDKHKILEESYKAVDTLTKPKPTVVKTTVERTRLDTIRIDTVRNGETITGVSKNSVPTNTFIKRDKYYKKLAENVYLLYNTDQMNTLTSIDEIKTMTGRTEFEVTEELAEGLIIQMEW